VAARADLLERFGEDIRYFNTFGANSVAIAAASAVLDVLEEEDLLRHTVGVGGALKDAVDRLAADHPTLRGVRGAGLYVGADVVDPETGAPDAARATRIVNGMRDRRVLMSSAGRDGTALKIRPPLPFARSDADEVVAALSDVLGSLD
jgi:4-aminobutyrate aminotransferase-like enzyme